MKRIKLFEEFNEPVSEGQDDSLQKIKTDMDGLKMDGHNHEGDLNVGKDYVSVEFRNLGNWEHDEEDPEREEEDPDYREDDDQMIWAPGEYKKYMAKFDAWAKGKSWYSQVKLSIDTSEKNWCSFTVTLK